MQCVSCQFENMPGVSNCGRCGAVLQLDAATIDVNPPRAKGWIKPWRGVRYFISRRRSIPANVSKLWASANDKFSSYLVRNTMPFAVIFRMIVPGWPQVYEGRKLFGILLFCGYCLSMPLSLLYISTAFGNVLLGVAITLHASSIVESVFARVDVQESRILYSIGYLLVTAFIIYAPAAYIVSRVALPMQFMIKIPPFNAGDVVLYNQSAYRRLAPQVGDLVVYRLPNERVFTFHNQQGQNVIYDFRGQEVPGRIIAGPGQRIFYDKRQLLVDGRPSQWSQLFSEYFHEDISTTLPNDSYFVLCGLTRITQSIPESLYPLFSVVPRESIVGRIYFQTQPLSRFGTLR
jgi:hypothetical protein